MKMQSKEIQLILVFLADYEHVVFYFYINAGSKSHTNWGLSVSPNNHKHVINVGS